jgi:hypothetical protein
MSSGAERAIEAGVRFVAASQLGSGEIPVMTSADPTMATGCEADPSIFPTGLAVLALAAVPGTAGIRSRAADYLRSEMTPEGLWRHWPSSHPDQAGLPPDLDDTAIVTAALRQEGRPVPDNLPILLANRDRHGRYYTWVAPRLRWSGWAHVQLSWSQLRHPATTFFFFNRYSADPTDVDAVVNANVIRLVGPQGDLDPVVGWLLEVLRSGTERRCDKWYENPFVIWYSLARALRGHAPDAEPLILDRLATARPSSALELALAVSTAVAVGGAPAASSIDALLAAQGPDGSWPRFAAYHGGRRRLRDGSFAPPAPGTPHWGSEALTTAFCLEALVAACS